MPCTVTQTDVILCLTSATTSLQCRVLFFIDEQFVLDHRSAEMLNNDQRYSPETPDDNKDVDDDDDGDEEYLMMMIKV